MTQRQDGVRRWSTQAAFAAAALATCCTSHASALATAPDWAGTYFANSPVDTSDSSHQETVATFAWSPAGLGAGDVLQISGDWGIAQPGGYTYGTANSSLYANGILVATCHSYDACWSGPSLVDWSFSFSAAQAASFDGEITLVAAANADEGGYYVGANQLSHLQLSAVPEPTPLLTMLAALGAFGARRLRRAGRD